MHLKWCYAEPVGREHVGTMVAVNRALARKLSAFGADPTATDATGLLRVTGSLHSGAGRMVEVLHLEQHNGRTIAYDPHAFAEGIVPRPAEASDAGTVLPTAADVHREARRDYAVARHRFTREGWHWALIEDMRTLPVIRWGGIVPEGWRLVRIFRPGEVFPEIVAVVSTIVDPDFVGRHLSPLCGTAMRLARDAHAGRGWIHTYRHGKQTMIDMLQITPAEQRHMRALISDAEHHRRRQVRRAEERRKAGAIECRQASHHHGVPDHALPRLFCVMAQSSGTRSRVLSSSASRWASTALRDRQGTGSNSAVAGKSPVGSLGAGIPIYHNAQTAAFSVAPRTSAHAKLLLSLGRGDAAEVLMVWTAPAPGIDADHFTDGFSVGCVVLVAFDVGPQKCRANERSCS
jgi:hypothetical protein